MNVILACLILFLFACGTFQIGVDSPAPTETQIAQSAGPPPTSTIAPPTQPMPTHTPSPLPPTSRPTPVIPTPTNSPDHTYSNSSYGFTFQYPETWTIEEAANFITLKQGHLHLRINYRKVEENVMLGPGGVSAGDLETRETIPFLDIGVRKTVLVYEGQDKAVFYGAPGTEVLRDTLAFTIFLIDSQPDYAQAVIPPETHTAVDQIVRSFQWLAAATPMAAVTSTPSLPATSTPIPELSTNKIVFAVSEGGIYIVDVNNNDVTMLLDSGLCCPHWSPDRQKIAFSNGSFGQYAVISVMNADGSNVRDLMRYRRTDGDMLPVRPAWSSDSQRVTWPWPFSPQYPEYKQNFVAVDIDTGIEVEVSESDGFASDDSRNYSIDYGGVTEVLSPDGQYIASVSDDRKRILISKANDGLFVKELIIEQEIYGVDW